MNLGARISAREFDWPLAFFRARRCERQGMQSLKDEAGRWVFGVGQAPEATSMGVTGLLPQLGPLIRHANFYAAASGRRVGVDGHVWLHQLAYAHAQSIVLDRDYKPLAADFLQRAQQALGPGFDLVFVFDGAPTPAKRETNEGRAVRRAKAIAALQFNLTEPDPKLLRAAAGLGWHAVEAVIRVLRKAGIT